MNNECEIKTKPFSIEARIPKKEKILKELAAAYFFGLTLLKNEINV